MHKDKLRIYGELRKFLDEDSETAANEVTTAAADLVAELLDRLQSLSGEIYLKSDMKAQREAQSLMAQLQMAQTAMSLPLASIGSCHCGAELRYKGLQRGLFVCCTGNPEHCWKLG